MRNWSQNIMCLRCFRNLDSWVCVFLLNIKNLNWWFKNIHNFMWSRYQFGNTLQWCSIFRTSATSSATLSKNEAPQSSVHLLCTDLLLVMIHLGVLLHSMLFLPKLFHQWLLLLPPMLLNVRDGEVSIKRKMIFLLCYWMH